MSDPPPSQLSLDEGRIDLENLRSAHQALRAMTLRMHLFVLLGLLAATVFTPSLIISGTGRERLNLIRSAWDLLRLPPAALGSTADHPLALPAGLALIKVGLVLVSLGVILSLLGSRTLVRMPLRTHHALMSSLTSFALVLGAGSLIGGVSALPSQVPIDLGFGVAFPVIAGVWLWHGAWSQRQLDWDWSASDH